MRILKFYFNINIQKKRGQETYYLTMNGFIVVVVFLVKNQFSHKKSERKHTVLFRNGQIRSQARTLKDCRGQHEDMTKVQNQMNHRIFLFASNHHRDHPREYRHIHQLISKQRLHIENYSFHELKRHNFLI